MTQSKQILQEMVAAYQHKVAADVSMIVQFNLSSAGDVWHIAVEPGGKVMLQDGPHSEALFIIIMSEETLAQIYRGEISALTAAGRERLSDPAPLNFKLGEGVAFTPKLYSQLITFVQRFFWHIDPECIRLGEEYSRMVHGGHAIPLFYSEGFRSAWYLVKKGEQINESGDHNPFPQGFVFISGQGKAEIGGKTITVKAGEAYYIPPGSNHMVWTESDDPLVLLWLAWGEGA